MALAEREGAPVPPTPRRFWRANRIDISNVRGGRATIEEALRRLKEGRDISTSMIGAQTADTVSAKFICLRHEVVEALLRTRRLDHKFVVDLRTKLIRELNAIDSGA